MRQQAFALLYNGIGKQPMPREPGPRAAETADSQSMGLPGNWDSQELSARSGRKPMPRTARELGSQSMGQLGNWTAETAKAPGSQSMGQLGNWTAETAKAPGSRGASALAPRLPLHPFARSAARSRQTKRMM